MVLTGKTTKALTKYIGMISGKRCSDFDEDCKFVKEHANCAAGSVVFWHGELKVVPPIDGFCPYVCGMMSKRIKKCSNF